MEILFIWIALSILAGWIAEQKGRSGVGFFFLALVLSPLIGLIAAAAVSKNDTALAAVDLREGKLCRCPQCAELVLIDAIKCKHCGSALPVHVKSPEGAPRPPVNHTALSYNLGRAFRKLVNPKKKR